MGKTLQHKPCGLGKGIVMFKSLRNWLFGTTAQTAPAPKPPVKRHRWYRRVPDEILLAINRDRYVGGMDYKTLMAKYRVSAGTIVRAVRLGPPKEAMLFVEMQQHAKPVAQPQMRKRMSKLQRLQVLNMLRQGYTTDKICEAVLGISRRSVVNLRYETNKIAKAIAEAKKNG